MSYHSPPGPAGPMRRMLGAFPGPGQPRLGLVVWAPLGRARDLGPAGNLTVQVAAVT